MTRAGRLLADGYLRSYLVMACIGVAGFVVFAAGWSSVAASARVAEQLPVVLFAGFGGMALIGAGFGLLWVQLQRRAAHQEADQLDEVLGQAFALAERRRQWASRP